MLYGYGSVEETEEGNVTAVFIDTIKYNEPVDEPPDWAEAPDYGIWNYREPLSTTPLGKSL